MKISGLNMHVAAAALAVFTLWPCPCVSAEPLSCEILRRESVIEFDSEGAYIISELMFIKKTGREDGPEFVTAVVDTENEELRDVRARVFTDLGGVISESEPDVPLYHLADMPGVAAAGKKKLVPDLAYLKPNTVLIFSYVIASAAEKAVFSRDICLASEYRTYERLLRISFPKDAGVFFGHSGNWSGISASRKESEGRIVLEWSSDGIDPAEYASSPVLAAALPGDWERALSHMERALRAEGHTEKPWYEVYDRRSIGRFPHRILNAGTGQINKKGLEFRFPSISLEDASGDISVSIKAVHDCSGKSIFWECTVNMPSLPDRDISTGRWAAGLMKTVDGMCAQDGKIRQAGELIVTKGRGRMSAVLSMRSSVKNGTPVFTEADPASFEKILGIRPGSGSSVVLTLKVYEYKEDPGYSNIMLTRSTVRNMIY